MDPQKSPMEVGKPLLPLQQRPPEYSTGFPPSQSYPSAPCQPAQHYGAPAASVQYVQGPNPVQTVVTVQPPANVSFNPESDYLCCSIITLLCCFMPLGSAALVYSITTRDANMFGHQPIASRNSKRARILNYVSVGVGLLLWLIGVIFFVLLIIMPYKYYR